MNDFQPLQSEHSLSSNSSSSNCNLPPSPIDKKAREVDKLLHPGRSSARPSEIPHVHRSLFHSVNEAFSSFYSAIAKNMKGLIAKWREMPRTMGRTIHQIFIRIGNSLGKSHKSAVDPISTLGEELDLLLSQEEDPVTHIRATSNGEIRDERRLHDSSKMIHSFNEPLICKAQQVAKAVKDGESGNGSLFIDGEKIDYSKSCDSEGIVKITFIYQNKKFHIHEYKKGIQNGIKIEDFYERVNLFISAAKKKVSDHPPDAITINQLDQIETRTKDELRDLFIKIDEKERDVIFKNKSGDFIDVLARSFKEVETLVRRKEKEFDLQLAEKEFLRDNERPVIINFYEREVENKHYRLFNIHAPVYPNTTPSSIQNDNRPANYIYSSAGYIDGDKPMIEHSLIRHSRPTPIAVGKGTKRRAMGALIIEQTIHDLVKNMGEEQSSSKDDPLVLPLSITTLLTGKKGDFLRNKKKGIYGTWSGESETLQLNEVAALYQLYHDKVMNVTIRGKELWIKPDILHINFGANSAAAGLGAIGKLPGNPFESQLNHYGEIGYAKRMNGFISSLEKDPSLSLLPFHQKKELQILLDKYEVYQKKIEKELEPLRKELLELYRARSGGDERKETVQAIRKREKEIEKKQAKLYSSSDKISKFLKEDFIHRKSSMKKSLEELRITCENNQNHKMALSVMEDWFLLQEAFYSDSYHDIKKILEPPVLANRLNHKLKVASMLFCKSAEDRTGIVEVKSIAKMIYELVDGAPLPSNYSVEHEGLYNDLFEESYSWTASLNTTEENSKARGFQISQKLLTPRMRAKAAALDIHARFAKRMPKKAKG